MLSWSRSCLQTEVSLPFRNFQRFGFATKKSLVNLKKDSKVSPKKKLSKKQALKEYRKDLQVNREHTDFVLGLDINSRFIGYTVLNKTGNAAECGVIDIQKPITVYDKALVVRKKLTEIREKFNVENGQTKWAVGVEDFLKGFGGLHYHMNILFTLAQINSLVTYECMNLFSCVPITVHPTAARSYFDIKKRLKTDDIKKIVWDHVSQRLPDYDWKRVKLSARSNTMKMSEDERQMGKLHETNYDIADSYILADFTLREYTLNMEHERKKKGKTKTTVFRDDMEDELGDSQEVLGDNIEEAENKTKMKIKNKKKSMIAKEIEEEEPQADDEFIGTSEVIEEEVKAIKPAKKSKDNKSKTKKINLKLVEEEEGAEDVVSEEASGDTLVTEEVEEVENIEEVAIRPKRKGGDSRRVAKVTVATVDDAEPAIEEEAVAAEIEEGVKEKRKKSNKSAKTIEVAEEAQLEQEGQIQESIESVESEIEVEVKETRKKSKLPKMVEFAQSEEQVEDVGSMEESEVLEAAIEPETIEVPLRSKRKSGKIVELVEEETLEESNEPEYASKDGAEVSNIEEEGDIIEDLEVETLPVKNRTEKKWLSKIEETKSITDAAKYLEESEKKFEGSALHTKVKNANIQLKLKNAQKESKLRSIPPSKNVKSIG